jgi:protein SCO1/2
LIDMPEINTASPQTNNRDERIILFFVLGFGLIAAALFCGFLVALHGHDEEVATTQTSGLAQLAIPATPNRRLASFSLTNQSGRAVTQADVQGDFLVMSFVFTTCSTTCPIISQRMEEIQQLTTNQPDVRLVTVTVDPEDDSAPVLAQYSQRFSADTQRWWFLTGADAAVHHLVGSILPPDTNSAFAYLPANYAHSDRIALITPQGRVLEYFDGLSTRTPAAVVRRISALRSQNEKPAL